LTEIQFNNPTIVKALKIDMIANFIYLTSKLLTFMIENVDNNFNLSILFFRLYRRSISCWLVSHSIIQLVENEFEVFPMSLKELNSKFKGAPVNLHL
jgi:hypothetical protein